MSALKKYVADKIDLKEDTLQVYLVDLRLFDSEQLLTILSDDEKQRAERLKVKDKREQFINSRGVLRELLSRCLVETKPEAIYFNYADHGKPVVNHTHMGKPIEFNLSHSGHYALYAFSLINKVGVDIEAISSSIELRSLAFRSFSEQEFSVLQELEHDDQLAAFYRCWTRKEAFIKGEGTGVGLGLGKITVSLDAKIKAAPIILSSEVKAEGEWYSYQPVTVPGFETGIAANSNKLRISAHVITN